MKASDYTEQELRVTSVSQATVEWLAKEMAKDLDDSIANNIQEDQNYQRRFGFEAYVEDKSRDWDSGSIPLRNGFSDFIIALDLLRKN